MEKTWDSVLQILSSLISPGNRSDNKARNDAHEHMPIWLERCGLKDDIHKLSIIHVAGTKGKGSTCAMVERMLRECGYRTGLYTSPHLVDVRERIRISGELVPRDVFEQHFWDVYERLRDSATPDVGLPSYFRFMTLLALRIFLAQGVDVVVLEVGIGGRLDATNVVPPPVVCGITSLGFDHMEILGDTLPKIAREKAGILKASSPGYTVEQPEDAMQMLKDCAVQAGTSLTLVAPFTRLRGPDGSSPPRLGISGAHQVINAGMAVTLASEWERRSPAGQSNPAAAARLEALDQNQLPAEYARGLEAVSWPGRSTVVHVEEFQEQRQQQQQQAGGSGAEEKSGAASGSGSRAEPVSRLAFYIDGAHTPESMATCADWFAEQANAQPLASGTTDHRRVLLFNCMKERDPSVLLSSLSSGLARRGLQLHHALFVPPESQYGFLPTSKRPVPPGSTLPASAAGPPTQVDLSWQAQLQQVWDGCSTAAWPAATATTGATAPGQIRGVLPAPGPSPAGVHTSAVAPCLPAALDWLRQYARGSPKVQLQVLVTGSLYLVGDVLRLLGRVPK